MNSHLTLFSHLVPCPRGHLPSCEYFTDLSHRLADICAQYRARNDMVNPIAAGFIAGGVLARNTGPRGAFWGGLGFAAFSAAIEHFLRRETPE